MVTIFLIYVIATIRGIFRVIFYKVGHKLPAYENLNESISEEKLIYTSKSLSLQQIKTQILSHLIRMMCLL